MVNNWGLIENLLNHVAQSLQDLLTSLINGRIFDKELNYIEQVCAVLSLLPKDIFTAENTFLIAVHSFLADYQAFLETQTFASIQGQNESLIRLENAIQQGLSIIDPKNPIHQLGFKAQGFRLDIITGFTPLDLDDYLQQSQKTRLAQEEEINSTEKWLEKITHQLDARKQASLLRQAKTMNTDPTLIKELGLFKTPCSPQGTNLPIFSDESVPIIPLNF